MQRTVPYLDQEQVGTFSKNTAPGASDAHAAKAAVTQGVALTSQVGDRGKRYPPDKDNGTTSWFILNCSNLDNDVSIPV